MRGTTASLAAAGLVLVLTGATSVAAQDRFQALAADTVSSTPDLQIITVRDSAQGACYLVFMMAPPPLPPRDRLQPADLAAAAMWRDRKLAEVSSVYEQSFGSQFVGTPANVMPYQFEAQKIEGEYQRLVRTTELAWFERQIERVMEAPRLAVSGPAPCGAAASARTRAVPGQ